MNKKNCISLFVILLVFLSSCTSLEEVRKYGTSIHATVAEVEPVAKDFHASCMRANVYKPCSQIKDCNTEKEASSAIIKVAKVLDAYGEALSALSSDELANDDKDINNLTNEIKNLNIEGLDDEKVGVIGNLGKLIAKAAISGYQQKEVATFISDCNDAVVNVSNTLADLIDIHYSQAIKLEISAWEDGCRQAEHARDSNYLEWVKFSNEQWKYRIELEGKLDSAKKLAKSIRNIGKTHAKLKADVNNLSSKKVAAAVRYFVNEAKPVIKEIEDSF